MIRDLLAELGEEKEGRIIIYSTHDISDLPIFATRIIFIKDDRIIMDNKLEELRKNLVYIIR